MNHSVEYLKNADDFLSITFKEALKLYDKINENISRE